jgi:hypothetical protein
VMRDGPASRWTESVLIVVATAALIAVALANVIRVNVSPAADITARAVLFGASWIAAIAWAAVEGRRAVLFWLGALAGCGALVVVCQANAGGVSGSSLLYLIGPGGAGVGVALLIQRCLARWPVWTAWAAALLGAVAAVWLAFEPEMELWKLLPNEWEMSKGLEYRWGIRMGEERARFLFDTPMEAGAVQWFLGSMCLAVSSARVAARVTNILLGAVVVLLYVSVALTYSRAGIVLGVLSVGLAALIFIPTRKGTVVACMLAGLVLPVMALIANRVDSEGSAALRNLTSILDPAEEANRIRLSQFAQGGRDLSETPWHGRGARSFVTFDEAPRMPEHESSPIGLIAAFGLGGAALVLLFAAHLVRRRREFVDSVFNKPLANRNALAVLVIVTSGPFAVYSLVAPVLAGEVFGLMCFTIFGLLAVWEPPLGHSSGKP